MLAVSRNKPSRFWQNRTSLACQNQSVFHHTVRQGLQATVSSPSPRNGEFLIVFATENAMLVSHRSESVIDLTAISLGHHIERSNK